MIPPLVGLGCLFPLDSNAALATGLAALPFYVAAHFSLSHTGGCTPKWPVSQCSCLQVTAQILGHRAAKVHAAGLAECKLGVSLCQSQ